MSLPHLPLRDSTNLIGPPRGRLPQVRSVPVLRSSSGQSPSVSPDMRRLNPEFPISSALPSSITSDNDGVELNCPCTSHSGKQLLDSVYPMSVDQMLILLFSESPWYEQFAATVRKTGFSATPWRMDDYDMAAKTRTLSYTIALNHAMAPKTATATENQTCYQYGKAGQIYVLHAETQTMGVPQASNFYVLITYCITRVAANECRLKVHGGIVYRKNIWGIIKGFIEKSTYSGLEEHYTVLDAMLKRECAKSGLPADQVKATVASDSSPAPAMTLMKKTLKKKIPRSSCRPSSDENELMLDALSLLSRAPAVILPAVSSKSSSLSRRERMNAEAANILADPHLKTSHLEFYAKAILAVSHKMDSEDLLTIYQMDRQNAALSSLERTIDSLNRVETQLLELKQSMDTARDQLRSAVAVEGNGVQFAFGYCT